MVPAVKKNILITGGTGFIGAHLTHLLLQNGYTVSILSRGKKKVAGGVTYYYWDVNKKIIAPEAVLKADYIIHLAGSSIAGGRWTKKRKEEILSSRIDSTQILFDTLQKNKKKLDGFVTASAIGIYGAFNSETICTEMTLAANDFVGTVCQQWEAAADQIGSLGIRTVKIRTGLVLGKKGGFLKPLIPIFKNKLGAALGTGKQYMPWIHIEDLCQIYLTAIQNETMNGSYNAVVDDATTNQHFSRKLASTFGYKLWLPNIPAFILQLLLGKMSNLLLKGQRVSSQKIKEAGFTFQYTDLEKALKEVLL